MVSYRVMLDVPGELILFVYGLLAARRREIGTRKGTRRLTCCKQALFGLAWFGDKGDIPRLGRGFRLSQSTAYRYLDEVIEVLAARAPGLAEQLERALAEGTPYLILDRKVVDTDRRRERTTSRNGKTIDLRYAGKDSRSSCPSQEARRSKRVGLNTRARNAQLRSARCLGERGFALLTQRWRTLQHVTASPAESV